MNLKPTLIPLLLFLSPFSGFAAEAGENEEVAADCRAEGEAMGMGDQDLEDYVEECVEEYHEAEMGNNIKLN